MKTLKDYILESKLDTQEVIDAIVGSYEQWEEDTKDEPGEWDVINNMYSAKEPNSIIIKDICFDLGVKPEELKKYFNTPEGKEAWKSAQNYYHK